MYDKGTFELFDVLALNEGLTQPYIRISFSLSLGRSFQSNCVSGKIGSVFGTPMVGPTYSVLGKMESKGAGCARRLYSVVFAGKVAKPFTLKDTSVKDKVTPHVFRSTARDFLR